MKQRLTSSRSTDTSILFPHNSDHSLTLLIFVIVVTLVTPLAHSKDQRHSPLDLRLNHHRGVVEDFKTKVLKHMGLREAPSLRRGFNVTRNSMHGKFIRNYLRNKLNTTHHNDEDDSSETKYVDRVQTLRFRSADRRIKVPVLPATAAATSNPPLTTVTFSTRFQQPDVPYYDLVVRSAILRLHIRRQKNKLQRKAKWSQNPLNVSVYLLSSHGNGYKGHPTATFLRSLTVNAAKFKKLKINIKSHLLSDYVENEDADVTFGIRIDDLGDASVRGHNRKTSLNAEQAPDLSIPEARRPFRRLVQISRAKLQVSVQTRDLRRTRTKRQADPSCTPGLCCRQSLYVDFEDIGWSDWVIYPVGYTAYICQGSCPSRYKIASTFTSIKNLLHERHPAQVPAATCAPTGYSSISMLVYTGSTDNGEDEIVEQEYPQMVVTGCRCY